jgi:hypothetical protein
MTFVQLEGIGGEWLPMPCEFEPADILLSAAIMDAQAERANILTNKLTLDGLCDPHDHSRASVSLT